MEKTIGCVFTISTLRQISWYYVLSVWDTLIPLLQTRRLARCTATSLYNDAIRIGIRIMLFYVQRMKVLFALSSNTSHGYWRQCMGLSITEDRIQVNIELKSMKRVANCVKICSIYLPCAMAQQFKLSAWFARICEAIIAFEFLEILHAWLRWISERNPLVVAACKLGAVAHLRIRPLAQQLHSLCSDESTETSNSILLAVGTVSLISHSWGLHYSHGCGTW